MTEKEKYTSKALLNEEKTWREFDRLSLKSKKKDKKDIKIERIETNIEKFKASKMIKSLESSFFQRKSELFTFSFIFESKSKTNKRIEMNKVETFDSLFIDTSSSWKEEQAEKSFEDSSITKEKTSTFHINTSIKSISIISKISTSQIIVKTRKMSEDSNIKTFWDKRNEKKNLEKYLKNIEFTYQTDYKTQEAHEKNKIKYKKNVHRILFRQNLREKVEKWYFDLKKTMKSDWKTLQTVFKTQFEMKADAKANKYLLLQKIATLNQRQNESIIEYFRRAKILARHLFNATKTIDYNVVKSMKNKSQKERVNFECNKDRNFSLKKIKQIIQAAYQTVDTVSSFDLEWRQIENSFNLFKEKDKALFSKEWNQQILFNILQDIRNITMQNKIKKQNKNENEEKSKSFNEERASRSYEESRNVNCFNCEQKDHDANECSKSRQIKETNSSFITTQVILSNEAKRREENSSKCILSNADVIIIIKNEEIKKKKMTQQAKKKKIILKRNKRINDEHDRYVTQQDDKRNETKNRNESNDMKMMSRMNQSKEFQDFDDESKNEKMIEYSENESIMMFKKNTISKKKIDY